MLTYHILLVACGGALGAVARYACGLAVSSSGFPWATYAVNVLGCLLIGFIAAGFPRLGEPARLFLVVGLLGGFTTFSAFSFEFFALLDRRETAAAFLYVAATLLAGAGAFAIGRAGARWLAA